jgi:hypothetical protein
MPTDKQREQNRAGVKRHDDKQRELGYKGRKVWATDNEHEAIKALLNVMRMEEATNALLASPPEEKPVDFDEVECWACNFTMTLDRWGSNDGFCPKCDSEIEIDEE